MRLYLQGRGVYDREQLQWFCCDECRQEWYEEEEKKEMEIEEQKKRERELEWERWEREE